MAKRTNGKFLPRILLGAAVAMGGGTARATDGSAPYWSGEHFENLQQAELEQQEQRIIEATDPAVKAAAVDAYIQLVKDFLAIQRSPDHKTSLLAVQRQVQRYALETGLLDDYPAAQAVLSELVNDTDDDGLADHDERTIYHTDPENIDTDTDGLSDGEEVYTVSQPDPFTFDKRHPIHLNPLAPDTDGDGLGDGVELDRRANPSQPDTDGDGLTDGLEANIYNTSLIDPDTDGDGISDGEEIHNHTLPRRNWLDSGR